MGKDDNKPPVSKYAAAALGAIGGITGGASLGATAGLTLGFILGWCIGDDRETIADFLKVAKYTALGNALLAGIAGAIRGTVIGIGASLVDHEVDPFTAGLLSNLANVNLLDSGTVDILQEVYQAGYDYLAGNSITDSPQVELAGSDADTIDIA